MNKNILGILALTVLTCGANATAEEDIVEAVLGSCKPEIENYCNQVTLGGGRLLACFYAHEDKLSAGCSYALYRAATTLEQMVSAFGYVAAACEIDINNLCVDVAPGEGRVLDCLQEHSECIRDECSEALSDLGLKQHTTGISLEM